MSNIKLSIPNDDGCALFHIGKSLIDLSSTIEGSPCWVVITQKEYDTLTRLKQVTEDLMQAAPAMLRENDVDGAMEIHGKRKYPGGELKSTGEYQPVNNEPSRFADVTSYDTQTKEVSHTVVEVDTTSQQVESLGEAVFSINGVEMHGEPAPDVSVQHLFKPEDYVSMYNPTTDVYRLAKSTAEIEECVDEGYEQHTREQYDAWKPRPCEQYDDEQGPPSTDSSNISWDERIHASSKALNTDGTWRVRRKPKDMTDDEWTMEVNDVKVEISESQRESEELCIDEGCDHHGTPHVCITPEPPVAVEGDNFHVDAGEVTEQEVAGIPPLPVPPLPAPPVVSDMTFPQVMAYLTERHGRISNAQVEQIIASMGLKSIMDLNTQPEHIGPFIALVKALLGE